MLRALFFGHTVRVCEACWVMIWWPLAITIILWAKRGDDSHSAHSVHWWRCKTMHRCPFPFFSGLIPSFGYVQKSTIMGCRPLATYIFFVICIGVMPRGWENSNTHSHRIPLQQQQVLFTLRCVPPSVWVMQPSSSRVLMVLSFTKYTPTFKIMLK